MVAALLSILLGSVLAAEEPASGEPAPPKIAAFLELCETSRKGAILELEHTWRGLQNEGAKTPQLTQRMAQIEEDLRVLKENKQPVVPTLRFPPVAGAIGRLPRLSCHIDQVLSDQEMLVRCFFPVKVVTVKHFRGYGETTMQPVTCVLRGVPTGELRDAMDVELLDVFEITGMQTYRTTDGRSHSAWALSRFDMRPVEPYFRALTKRP